MFQRNLYVIVRGYTFAVEKTITNKNIYNYDRKKISS